MTAFGRKNIRQTRRSNVRQAWVVIPGEFRVLPCTVLDTSEGGAKITSQHLRRIPSTFVLSFSKESRHGHACEVRWREGDAIGLRFV